jgi:hypothetical protein
MFQKTKMITAKKTLIFLLLWAFLVPNSAFWPAKQVLADEDADTFQQDYEKYLKYELYLKYEKAQKYDKYKDYKEAKKKYKFETSAERHLAKDHYDKYKLFKKNPLTYPQYAVYYDDYKKYKKYKSKYKPLKKYSKYKKYKKYDKYDKREYKNYGSGEYKNAHQRYTSALRRARASKGEADLGCGIKDASDRCLGPEITAGLWVYTKNQLRDDDFKIEANKDYIIKDSTGKTLATVTGATQTYVRYDGDNRFKIYHSVATPLYSENIVYFEAADGDNSDLIFDAHKPDSSLDKYRGKIRLDLYDTSGSSNDRIWVVNALPLEQYVWGMGEITGTGDTDHNRVMTTMFRTYGYWKIKFSTKHAALGFKVDTTAGDQIYYGYNWETDHPRIKEAAEDTWGKLVMYVNTNGLNEVTLTPYSSWTDGRTRSFQERWGSRNYPWCRSVSDPYGKHPTKDTETLEKEGNHMVGLSAHGSLELATNHNKSWEWILNYYFHNINLRKAY